MKQSVFITGASSGIGLACADFLAGAGFAVFAGVRSNTDCDQLAQRHGNIFPLICDVTDLASLERARDEIATKSPSPLFGLVNNAGISTGGPIEFTNLDEARCVFETNIMGPLAVTQIFLPQLRAAKGRIVNISSVSGLIAFPGLGVYAASKFALEAISDACRQELKPHGVRVSVIEPGNVATPIWDKTKAKVQPTLESLAADKFALYAEVIQAALNTASDPRGIPATTVADKVYHALTSRRPRKRYLVGKESIPVKILKSLPQGFRDWLIAKGVKITARKTIFSNQK